MKKSFLLLFFIVLFLSTTTNIKAQIKLYDDGHVSLGDVAKTYGIQIQPTGFFYHKTRSNNAYSWANLSEANHKTQKHWIVENKYCSDCWNTHMFYVQGNGHIYSTGIYSITADCCNNTHNREGIDGEQALSIILGLHGYYYEDGSMATPEEIENNENIDKDAVEGMITDLGKRSLGLSTDDMVNVFPDAIRTDPQSRLCIDYHSVIIMLVEAMKQQQQQIDELQKKLDKYDMPITH